MDLPGPLSRLHRNDRNRAPARRRWLVFGVTLVLAGALLGLLESGGRDEAEPAPQITRLKLPERALTETVAPGPDGAAETPADADVTWDAVTVRRGQTLDAIFRARGYSIPLLHRILALNGDTRGLTRIRPGDVFDFRENDDGSLRAMRYALDEARYLIVDVTADALDSRVEQREIVAEMTEAEGVIESSLFLAGKHAGLSDAMVMNLANIFGWDIDFVLDIRQGDRFMLIYEKLYREGEFLRDGRILAATFVNQGQRFQAVWFENGDTADYFDPEGRNMRKAFLRAPLNFSYISSGFNPRRMHPVLKRVRPHNGTDYYAPPGTPVYAAGDGTVIRSAYSKANGHHVFIKHANSIVTKYLHFSKRLVKQGQKVKQGQTIGTVGSTGLASGPHLHYEFLLNGVHRNPRTVPLPKVEPLGGEMLTAFRRHAAPMLTQLSRMESASLYASRE